MNKIMLEKEDVYRGNLLLVNADHPLKNNTIAKLISADAQFPDILMEDNAAKYLQLVLQKISSGNTIIPVSGYRSEEEQTSIYTNSLKENGEEYTKKYVALPNCSEHQTGLAIDLAKNKSDIDFICPDFPYEGICEDFRNNAPDYGFIQRYAENKEKITGISHEPWHFRYVGFPHSKIITKNDFSLEEYMEFIKKFSFENRFIFKCGNGKKIEIFYIKLDYDKVEILLPENSIYQISGNNFDGVIVTVWRH